MSVEPGRTCAPDKALKQQRWDRLIASKQTVSTFAVMLETGELVSLDLTQAQAEGLECLTCKRQCGTGQGAFRPVGLIPSVGSVFECVACLDGVR